jgi:hypothetical protein
MGRELEEIAKREESRSDRRKRAVEEVLGLHQYLKRVGRVDSARCPACGADTETTEHYLLLCPAYAYERWALGMQARKQGKPLTLKTILGERGMVIPLANYIDATHRFKGEGKQNERAN